MQPLFTRPLLAPPGPGYDPLNFQITVGWTGFYFTACWDHYNKLIRLGLGILSLWLAWI